MESAGRWFSLRQIGRGLITVSRLSRLNPINWPLIRRFRRGQFHSGDWIQGRYLLGPEVTSFQPKGGTERWWTSFSDTLAKEANELQEAARGSGVEVELSGELSEHGAYGHMGQYARTFHVQRIRR